MSRSSGKNDCRVYVGNLPPDIRSKDVEDIFYKYGKISNVDLKNRRGPPFAFVEFEDPRDAEDAVDKRDGYDYDGYKLRVEFPRGGRREGGSSYGGGGGGRDRDGGGYRGDRGGGRGFGGGRFGDRGGGRGQTRRSQYRVLITGLPLSGSWQDLKDHMREAGDVCFADSYKDGTGVVEFLREEDMKYAIKKLNDTKFRSHEGDTAYIRVKEDRGKGRDNKSRSRSRSRSPRRSSSRSKSRSRSPRSKSKSKSKSKSRSKSPPRERERERSRSPAPRSRSRSPSRSRSRTPDN